VRLSGSRLRLHDKTTSCWTRGLMPVQSHEKQKIAFTQLETALRLFAEGADYYSVVTLAGAADEIFGKLLQSRGKVSALASLTRASVAIHLTVHGVQGSEKEFANRANLARNALKHLEAGGAQEVELDIHQEAVDMLDRAISNYWALTDSLSPAMESFERQRRAT
jgi:hypothetical protein